MIRRARWLWRRSAIAVAIAVLPFPGVGRLRAATLPPPDAALTVGNIIPFDAFVDEQGRDFAALVNAGDARPWIVSPIYTRCRYTCLPITAALRSALRQSGLQASEYRVLSFSFDPNETAESLAGFRHQLQLPAEWLTLRAKERESLERTLRALDFRTITMGDGQFEHPNLIAFLTPDRRLAGYLLGVTFSPSQLAAAVRGARNGVSPLAGWAGSVFAAAAIGLVASAFLFVTLLSKRRAAQLSADR